MITIAFALAAAAVAEQLAPAGQGMLQCQMPDRLFKTCASLTKIAAAGASTYRFETSMLVDPRGPVIVTITSAVTVRGEEVCDDMNPADFDAATVTLGGKLLPRAAAAPHIAKIRRGFAALERKQVCTRIVPGEQGTLKVEGRVQGKRLPALDYDMIWVGPKDGWTVAR